MKLLIADDNPAIRELLHKLCAGVATEMRDCANGAEAVALFKDFQPDWTLMDLAMPEMDGLAATAKIKAAFPSARIIVITQQRGPEYHHAALQAGAYSVVLKEHLHSLPRLMVQNSNQNL